MFNACGNAKVLSCPYHMWRYALDGRLEHVPQHLEQFPDVKLEQWGLLRGRVEVWAGLVFVHPDANAQPLQLWLGGLAERLKRFDTSGLQQQVRKVFSMQANWKFYIENHIDWLHLYFLHAKSLRDYEHDGGELQQHGPHWTSFELPRKNRAASAQARNAGMTPLPALTDEDADVGAHFVFPNLALLTNRYSFATLVVQPVGAEACEVEMRVQVMPGNEGGLFGSEDFEQVMFEDRHAAEQLQKAARSRAFGVGPMAMGWEAAIASFHASYRHHLGIA